MMLLDLGAPLPLGGATIRAPSAIFWASLYPVITI